MQPSIRPSRSAQPTLIDLLVFQLKVWGLQLRRTIIDLWNRSIRAYPPNRQQPDILGPILAESRSPIWGTSVPGLVTSRIDLEQPLIAGKIHNLRVAISQLNGAEIPAGAVFSFWAQIGQPSRFRGYVKGRELRQGCIVPTIAGGLCQLANALYQVALDADLEIVERHRHSTIVSGSDAETDRDATIFWNYVDLRFRVDRSIRIEAQLTSDTLIIRLRGTQVEISPDVLKSAPIVNLAPNEQTASCQSCQATDCIRKLTIPSTAEKFGSTAYLVDEYWAEFDRYLQQQRTERDLLLVPLDGQRWRKPNYNWTQTGFGAVHRATSATLMRSIASRNMPLQGSSRQQILLSQDAKLAAQFSKSLTYDVTHLVVMQNLLPYLWQSGVLGGRTFDVLMTRLPISNLQLQLTAAHEIYPESPTLGDFRADRSLLELERQALQSARKIITPHRQIAALFSDRAILLDWQLPIIDCLPLQGKKILFPSATLGRKGAYELRAIVQALDLELTVLKPFLEGQNFWDGVKITTLDSPQERLRQRLSLDGVGLVILPAHVEHKPRFLLRAIACGIPVIATEACGLGEMAGVTTIPVGDVDALRSAIIKYCHPQFASSRERAQAAQLDFT
jgi:VanW like protein